MTVAVIDKGLCKILIDRSRYSDPFYTFTD
jgi:hypothetical protein